jgi:acetoin utilization deacetylase AcuC-like enzyme
MTTELMAELKEGLDDPSGLPVVFSNAHHLYAPATELSGGVQIPAFDSVSRIERILAAMQRTGGGWHACEAMPHGRDPILSVHDRSLVEFLEGAWDSLGPQRPPGTEQLVADTFLHGRLRAGMGPGPTPISDGGALGNFCYDTYGSIGPGTFAAALGAVDAALTAVDLVREGARCALGLTRPPGHHVSRDLFGGGCYLNNAGISAQSLRDAGFAKVAVVDIDFHHGNGTQSLFYDRGDVMYGSVHGDPRRHYPYYLGWPNERGVGDGEGATFNAPLPPQPRANEYRACLAQVLEAIAGFAPDALVVSLGVDTLAGDPSGDGELTSADLWPIGADLGSLGIPSVLLLEGGYELERLGLAFTTCVRGFTEGMALR